MDEARRVRLGRAPDGLFVSTLGSHPLRFHPGTARRHLRWRDCGLPLRVRHVRGCITRSRRDHPQAAEDVRRGVLPRLRDHPDRDARLRLLQRRPPGGCERPRYHCGESADARALDRVQDHGDLLLRGDEAGLDVDLQRRHVPPSLPGRRWSDRARVASKRRRRRRRCRRRRNYQWLLSFAACRRRRRRNYLQLQYLKPPQVPGPRGREEGARDRLGLGAEQEGRRTRNLFEGFVASVAPARYLYRDRPPPRARRDLRQVRAPRGLAFARGPANRSRRARGRAARARLPPPGAAPERQVSSVTFCGRRAEFRTPSTRHGCGALLGALLRRAGDADVSLVGFGPRHARRLRLRAAAVHQQRLLGLSGLQVLGAGGGGPARLRAALRPVD